MKGTNNSIDDPRSTLIIVGEDGKLYKLTKSQWTQFEAAEEDLARAGVVNQLAEWGTYLAFLPIHKATGFGLNCTVVNLRAILKGEGGSDDSSAESKRDEAAAPLKSARKV